jgi:type II secretory pathway pseudopilin PulG
LLELVIVVAIIGVIATIAAGRINSASDRAKAAAVAHGVKDIQTAIDLYTVEHQGRSPAHDGLGDWTDDYAALHQRLESRTNLKGMVIASGICGPYLRKVPVNPWSTCPWIRIDGTTTRGSCSWRFDTETGAVTADHNPTAWDLPHAH